MPFQTNHVQRGNIDTYRTTGVLSSYTVDSVHVCCVQKTRFRNSGSVFWLSFLFNPTMNFHLRPSGDPEAAVSGLAGVSVSLSERAEATPFDWISVIDGICTAGFIGSCRVNSRRSDRRHLFLGSVYTPNRLHPRCYQRLFLPKIVQPLTDNEAW